MAKRVALFSSLAVILGGLIGTLTGACESEATHMPPTPVELPPGTVLTVDGLPITQAEIDRVAEWVGVLKPEEVQAARRRQALTHLILPRAAVASAWPEERAAALEAARTRLAELRDEVLPSGPPEPVSDLEGTWGDLGLELWGTALDGPEGEWQAPLEAIGRFWLLRRTGPAEIPRHADTTVRIQCVPFDYLPAGALPDEAIDQSLLEFADPAWRELVPAAWTHRMRGTRP